MPAAPASPLLALPGLLFGGIVRVRNALYSAGYLRQERLSRPVISIGNLTLGGTGKTPFAVFVADLLCRLGAVPALLSRGYGRRSDGDLLVVPPGETVEQATLVLGDEPALVRRKVPAIWVGISRDRCAAGLQILEKGCLPIFILDDGFQHRKLYRDLDVLILDATQPLEANRVIPGGSLREPVIGLRRAHVIVINESFSRNRNEQLREVVRKLHPEIQVCNCTQRVDSFVPISDWLRSPGGGREARVSGPVYLVAAVGNTERFRLSIESMGLEVKGCRFFRDHYALSKREWDECGREAFRSGADILITTEKDAIKLDHAPDLPLFVALQSTRLEQSADFEQMIRSMLEGAE